MNVLLPSSPCPGQEIAALSRSNTLAFFLIPSPTPHIQHVGSPYSNYPESSSNNLHSWPHGPSHDHLPGVVQPSNLSPCFHIGKHKLNHLSSIRNLTTAPSLLGVELKSSQCTKLFMTCDLLTLYSSISPLPIPSHWHYSSNTLGSSLPQGLFTCSSLRMERSPSRHSPSHLLKSSFNYYFLKENFLTHPIWNCPPVCSITSCPLPCFLFLHSTNDHLI